MEPGYWVCDRLRAKYCRLWRKNMAKNITDDISVDFDVHTILREICYPKYLIYQIGFGNCIWNKMSISGSPIRVKNSNRPWLPVHKYKYSCYSKLSIRELVISAAWYSKFVNFKSSTKGVAEIRKPSGKALPLSVEKTKRGEEVFEKEESYWEFSLTMRETHNFISNCVILLSFLQDAMYSRFLPHETWYTFYRRWGPFRGKKKNDFWFWDDNFVVRNAMNSIFILTGSSCLFYVCCTPFCVFRVLKSFSFCWIY